MAESNQFFLTSPLYYVNASPHMGSVYTTMICDTLCRFWDMYGLQVTFTTGVDEHGGKIEKTAQANNVPAQTHCDLVSDEFIQLWESLNINYTHFSRTTSNHHKRFVRTFWEVVKAKGDIYEAEYEGLYCIDCEDFKNIRDLEEGNVCPLHKKPVSVYKEKNYFFRLSKYAEQIKDFLHGNPEFLKPQYRMGEVNSWIESGLKDFPISRSSVAWGIPVPDDASQTIYVWFDALLGYLSPLVADPTSLDELSDFVGYSHIVGKDILRFHAVYWIGMLLSAGIPLPQHVFGHGFLTKDGQKMGKSLGNVLCPYELVSKFGLDAVRFYFMFQIPFGADGDYSESVFIETVNSYLANRLGNLCSRVLKMFFKNMNGMIPEYIDLVSSTSKIRDISIKAPEQVAECMKKFEVHNALAQIFEVVDALNMQLSDTKPWNLFKEDSVDSQKQAECIIVETLESLRIIASLLNPFMPDISAKMLNIFSLKNPQDWNDMSTWGLLGNCSINNISEALFQRISTDTIAN